MVSNCNCIVYLFLPSLHTSLGAQEESLHQKALKLSHKKDSLPPISVMILFIHTRLTPQSKNHVFLLGGPPLLNRRIPNGLLTLGAVRMRNPSVESLRGKAAISYAAKTPPTHTH